MKALKDILDSHEVNPIASTMKTFPQLRAERELHFEKALKSLRNEQIRESLQIASQAVKEFGSHVSLQCIILDCLYRTNDREAYVPYLLEVINLFKSVAKKLNSQSLLRTTIFLSKALEDEGFIYECEVILEMAINQFRGTGERESYYRLLAQKLRVSASFNLKDLHHDFQKLMNVKKEFPGLYVSEDIQHAVFLAEFQIFGKNIAKKSFQKLLNNSQSDYDCGLWTTDFLELGYLLGSKVDLNGKYTSSDKYQQIVGQIILEHSIPDLGNLRSLSVGDQLRICAIILSKSSQTQFRKYFEILLSSFSRQSGEIWRKRIGQEVIAQEQRALFDPSCGEISFDGKSIKVPTKSRMYILLKELQSGNSELLTLQRAIWGDRSSPESVYHRLRNLGLRINKLVRTELGSPNIVKIAKECSLYLGS